MAFIFIQITDFETFLVRKNSWNREIINAILRLVEKLNDLETLSARLNYETKVIIKNVPSLIIGWIDEHK